MASLRGLLVLLVSFAAIASTSVASTTTYYYMSDIGTCAKYDLGQYVAQFNSFGDKAYVDAWKASRVNPVAYGCKMKISSYAGYNLRYKFDILDFINDCDIIVKIYDGSFADGIPMASYSCQDNLPSSYIYSHSGFLTIELVNPVPRHVNYDFTISVQTYDPYHSYYTAGDIAATVLSIFAFVIVIAALSVCLVRRRRRVRLARQALIVSTPATTPYPVGAAPYPTSYGSTSNTAPQARSPQPPVYPGGQPAGYAGPAAPGYPTAPQPPPGYLPAGAVDSKPPPPVYTS